MDTCAKDQSVHASGKLRLMLVGELRVAEFALRGMIRAGHPPVAIVTTDVTAVRARSGMAASYYADLRAIACVCGAAVRIVSDLNAEPEAISAAHLITCSSLDGRISFGMMSLPLRRV